MILLLVAFDLEGTLVDAELFPEVGNRFGNGALLDRVTQRAMNGELGYEESLFRRLRIVQGLPLREMKEVCLQMPLYKGAKETVEALKGLNCTPAILTGGFEILAKRVAVELGIEYVYANKFIVERGCVASLRRPIITPEFKAKQILKIAWNLEIGPDHCIAVGDGANDIPMMEVAGLSIGFNAKRCVREQADVVVMGDDLREILPYITSYKKKLEVLPSPCSS